MAFSTFSYLSLFLLTYLLDSGKYSKERLITVLFGINAIYHYHLGLRDSVRPEHYGRLSRILNRDFSDFSDSIKSIFDQRKMMTTIAESIGIFLINIFALIVNTNLRYLTFVGFISNLIGLSFYTSNEKVKDPLLKSEEEDRFKNFVFN